MSDSSAIRKKAINAMKAVTAGALLCAGIACSGDDDTEGPEWNINQSNDADVTTTDAGSDTGKTDAGVDCNDEYSNDICPEHCDEHNDVDCCENIDYGYGHWSDEHGCSVAVPGPFVPPAMAR